MTLSEGITLLASGGDFCQNTLVHRQLDLNGRYVTIYCVEAVALTPSFSFGQNRDDAPRGFSAPHTLDDVIIKIGNNNFALKMKVESGSWNVILKDCWIRPSEEIRVSCASDRRYCVHGVCSDRPIGAS